MAKLPDSEVIVHGLLVSFADRVDFESKSVTGYRATIVDASGGAVVVNFGLADVVPFAPAMTQIIWRVRSGAYAVEGNSGMSTKFIRVVDEAELLGLLAVLEENAQRLAAVSK